MASLESLNDDCLREILEYCDTNDHIAFVVAFKQYKPLVQDIWKRFWRQLRLLSSSNVIKICCPHNDDWREISSQSLKIVVDLIQPFVEEIYIIGNNKEMLDIINASQFTKATMLSLDHTSASPIVKSCFPNLRSLVLVLHSVFKYSPEWNGLENLNVSSSQMSTSELMEFISKLKLKKLTINRFKQPIPEQYRNYEYLSELEEISGPANGVKELLNALNVMQKLRKVFITYDYYDFNSNSTFSKMLGTRAVEFFTICKGPALDSITNLENRLTELPNLKRLTLDCSDIDPIQMCSRVCHLHLLKAIILRNIRIDAKILTYILTSVPQLELLELEISSSSMDSTRPMHLDVAKIAQKRSKPITINVDDNKIEILLSAQTDLIKITRNPIVHQYFYCCEYILEQK